MQGEREGMSTRQAEGFVVALDVSAHCVETEARARYRAAMTDAVDRPDLSEEQCAFIATLETFLRETDLRAMRAQHPETAGGTPGSVEVRQDDRGGVTWRFVPAPTTR